MKNISLLATEDTNLNHHHLKRLVLLRVSLKISFLIVTTLNKIKKNLKCFQFNESCNHLSLTLKKSIELRKHFIAELVNLDIEAVPNHYILCMDSLVINY